MSDTVNCRCVLTPTQPRKAFFQPCPDAHPVEVELVAPHGAEKMLVRAVHGTPFHILTTAGYGIINLTSVRAEHVRLLEVRA